MEHEEDDNEITSEDMVLFPLGTEIFPPNEEDEVVIKFPTQEDAIVFYELLKSYSLSEFEIEITGRRGG